MVAKRRTPKGVNPAVWASHRAAHRAAVKSRQEQDIEQKFVAETAKHEERADPTPARPPVGWPDKDGLLVLDGGSRAKQDKKRAKPATPKADRDRMLESLSLLKSVDITAFNFEAEKHFVWWLTRAIQEADFQMVRLQWVYQNASFELNISPETVKRYTVKHTADRAEFVSRDGFLLLRDEEGKNGTNRSKR